MNKRIISVLMSVLIAISFSACSAKNDNQSETITQKNVQQDNSSKPSDVFCITYNDTVIYPNMDYSTVSSGLGEPESQKDIDNDGRGVSYIFDGMEVDTAFMNSKEIITRIEVLKSTIPTNDGIEVAMPVDMVESKSSVSFQSSGNTMSYTEKDISITLSFDESGIYSIDIASDNA